MCLTPISIKNRPKKLTPQHINSMATMAVNCGRCPSCLKKRVDQWIFRLQNEEKLHRYAYFITLTYSDEFLPVTEHGEITLFKPHVQKFLKRLRKAAKKPLKYYYCGEYGSNTERPHYHMILFASDVYEQDIHDEWPYGHCHIGDVTTDSIAYTCKYIAKHLGKTQKNSSRQPEYSNMSKGMGINYLTPSMINYYHKTLNSYITKDGGIRQALPRYYKDKLGLSDGQRLYINLKMSALHDQKHKKLIEEHGSLAEINRLDYYRIQQSVINFKKSQINKRTKI